jgi:MazG family protein
VSRTSTSLDALLDLLQLPPRAVQAFDPAYPQFSAARPLLVLSEEFETARAHLERRLPPDHAARVVSDGAVAATTIDALPLAAEAWLIEPASPESDFASIEGLRGVMERLFGPDGCPWDQEQTHESLRKYFLEEAYEVVDAIDRGDLDGLREELGDVLAHVFMQTALAQQSGAFTAEDVAGAATRKMVRRHPHVFGDEVAGSQEQLLRRWDELKAEERAENGHTESVDDAYASVPLAAPALTRAQDLLGRAQRSGDVVTPDAAEAAAALDAAVAACSAPPEAAELGAVLWAIVGLARAIDADAEEALRVTSSAFVEAQRALVRGSSEAP